MPRVSETWSDAELREFSKEHLLYEINMLIHCGAITTSPVTGVLVTPVVNNLAIEGFGIHLRGLLEFLYCEGRKDDVIAADYMPTGKLWTPPSKSPELELAWARVNKEVGHLTASRKASNDPMKGWAFSPLLREVLTICSQFAIAADVNKLAAEVRDFLK